MYTVNYRDIDGWQVVGAGDDTTSAEDLYQQYAALYKFVTLIQTQTTTNQVIIHDSTAS